MSDQFKCPICKIGTMKTTGQSQNVYSKKYYKHCCDSCSAPLLMENENRELV